MRKNNCEIPTGDDTRFDRLVDGELGEAERRELLVGLDREPGELAAVRPGVPRRAMLEAGRRSGCQPAARTGCQPARFTAGCQPAATAAVSLAAPGGDRAGNGGQFPGSLVVGLVDAASPVRPGQCPDRDEDYGCSNGQAVWRGAGTDRRRQAGRIVPRRYALGSVAAGHPFHTRQWVGAGAVAPLTGHRARQPRRRLGAEPPTGHPGRGPASVGPHGAPGATAARVGPRAVGGRAAIGRPRGSS